MYGRKCVVNWVVFCFFILSNDCAATITFNGCDNTPNDYFDFTAGTSDYVITQNYVIAQCIPKLNPSEETTIKLVIPGSVDGNQVSLGAQAFNWLSYGAFGNLKVELIFRKAGGMYVQMPTNCQNMFCEMNGGIQKTRIHFGGICTSGVENMANMFQNCTRLTSLDLLTFDTSRVSTMEEMFSGCSALTSLDLRSFDTRNVTTMNWMFYECSSLEAIDLSSFNTGATTNMYGMFEGCSALTYLNASTLNVSNATILEGLFYRCSNLTVLDLSGFNTAAATTMRNMFSGCSKVKTIKVSESFIVPADYGGIFMDCDPALRFVGTNAANFGFIEADSTTKSAIDDDANSVYVISTGTDSTGISSSLLGAISTFSWLLTSPKYGMPNSANLFAMTKDDAAYIGLSNEEETLMVDTTNNTTAWALATTVPAGSWNGITYGNGLFVSAGQNGPAMWSDDNGLNWTEATDVPSGKWNEVAFGNGKFVAIGTDKTGMYSEDGKTWTALTGDTVSSGKWYSIDYINNKFIVMGTDQKMMYSPDGLNWTSSILPSGTWHDIAYNGELYVSVSNGGGVIWSDDLATWTAVDAADLPYTEALWEGIAYLNGRFAAVATGGEAMWSSDGKVWNRAAIVPYAKWCGLTCDGEKFVAVASASNNNASRVMMSIDGNVWSRVSAAPLARWNKIAYVDGRFVAVALGVTANKGVMYCSNIGNRILGNLINKTVGEINYKPANINLSGHAYLQGDNSEYGMGVFRIGNGTVHTEVTMENALSFPQTEVIIEPKGHLSLNGSGSYNISNDITARRGASIKASSSFTLKRGATIRLGW